MTKLYRPTAIYWVLFAGPVGDAVKSALGRFFEAQTWYKAIPWELLGLAWVFFILGVIIRDFMDRDSWIRKDLRLLTRCVEITAVATAYKTRPPQRAWLEATVHFRFVRDLRDVHVVTRISTNTNLKHACRQFLLQQCHHAHINKGRTERFVVAIVPLQDAPGVVLGPQCWSDTYREAGDVVGAEPLSAGTENFVDIEVSSRWFRQRERIFLAALSTNTMEHGRVFIVWPGTPAALTIDPTSVAPPGSEEMS
jgi:hypothetical protein